MAVVATNLASGYIAILYIILRGLCKLGFFYFNIIKNKKRERLQKALKKN